MARNPIRRRRVVRRPKRATKKVAKLSPPMKKAIQKIVKGNIETKFLGDVGSLNVVAFNSGVSANGDAFFQVSNLQPGTGSNERIGDTISAVTCKWHGSLFLTNPISSATNRMIGARVMVLRCKTSPIATTSLPWTSLLQGDTGYNAFVGNQINLYQRINRNDFEVFYDKTFHFYEVWSTTATQAFIDSKNLIQYFSASASHKGKIKFEDGTNSCAWNPFLCIGYAYEDGSNTIDTVTTNITVVANQEMFFKDA